jgi:type IV pilus assembly protein PilN
MANINLLPWREELREERRQEFVVGLGITVAIAGMILFAGDRYVNNSINNQAGLNDYLRSQITLLDQVYPVSPSWT